MTIERMKVWEKQVTFNLHFMIYRAIIDIFTIDSYRIEWTNAVAFIVSAHISFSSFFLAFGHFHLFLCFHCVDAARYRIKMFIYHLCIEWWYGGGICRILTIIMYVLSSLVWRYATIMGLLNYIWTNLEANDVTLAPQCHIFGTWTVKRRYVYCIHVFVYVLDVECVHRNKRDEHKARSS